MKIILKGKPANTLNPAINKSIRDFYKSSIKSLLERYGLSYDMRNEANECGFQAVFGFAKHVTEEWAENQDACIVWS